MFAVEITEMIFRLLSPEDLASCALVCRSWRDAINSDIIWRKHCRHRGWTTMLKDWACFQNSSHLWLGTFFTSDLDHQKLPPLCKQRECFNKYAFLKKNWKTHKCATFRLNKPSTVVAGNATSYFACDGKYLVMFENFSKQLLVWMLEGKPQKVICGPYQKMEVSNLIVGSDTFAMVQGPDVSVYINNGLGFELAYIKYEFVKLLTIYRYTTEDPISVKLQLNNDYLVGCVYYTEYFAYIWDRKSGDSIASIELDAQYSVLFMMKLFGSKVYFGKCSNLNIDHKVVEFDIKLKCWSNFYADCLPHIKQFTVQNDYVCLVSSESERRDFNNCVCVFNQATGMIIKSFNGCGKNYQFVNNYIIYHYNAKIVVQSLEEEQPFREIYLNECVLKLKTVFDSLIVVNTADKVEVWDWVLEKRLYTAFYSFGSPVKMWVDSEKIILNRSKSKEVVVLHF